MTRAGKCAVCGDRYQTDDEYREHAFGSHTPKDFINEGENKTAVKVGWFGVAAALIVGVGSVLFAARANHYAKASEERLDYEQDHKFADNVYLGEAPQYYYDDHPKDGDNITWVVLNGSGIEIRNVWIQGKGDTWIRIDGIQRCTMYRAPAGFAPVAVHFTDPVSINDEFVWRRTTSGALTPDGRPMPTEEEDPKDDGNSDDPMTVQDCSG
jgi:hypothetical protein